MAFASSERLRWHSKLTVFSVLGFRFRSGGPLIERGKKLPRQRTLAACARLNLLPKVSVDVLFQLVVADETKSTYRTLEGNILIQRVDGRKPARAQAHVKSARAYRV